MPYYRGDYYQGDNYYAAGGIFGSIRKLLGGVAKSALSLTPIGKAVQVVSKVGKALAPVRRALPAALSGGAGAAITARLAMPGPTQLQAPELLSGGGLGGGGGGGFGRSRRMNVTNVKALRRAGRRVRGFLKLARRFGALPISPKGKKLFRARRKK